MANLLSGLHAIRFVTAPSLPTACRRASLQYVCSQSSFRTGTRHVSQAPPKKELDSGNTYTQPPSKLSQDVTAAEERHYDRTVEENKRKQRKSPWMRDGADVPPTEKIGTTRSFARGKLLTTPSRMLKLIIPLARRDVSPGDRQDKELEPLALLVHPQQPLSYLERLVQSELPSIKTDDGKERIPEVSFRAPQAEEDEHDESEDGGRRRAKRIRSEKEKARVSDDKDSKHLEDGDEMVIDGKRVQTGKLKSSTGDNPSEKNMKQSQTDEEQSQQRSKDKFVKWSSSTEIGDFIRDAARARHFALEIEGAANPILVGVPTFEDRTYYLRMRMRQKALEIARLAGIKRECDRIAERGAKLVGYGIGVSLVVYWILVYYLTFHTSLGWDALEPTTYLVGLSTLIGGYAWFLVHNRQVSYRSAMNFTISRRQSKLYEQKGFDVERWEELVDEANKLRREIKMIAEEYDVDWNEKDEAKSKKVIEALDKEINKRKNKKEDKDEDDEDS